MENERIRRLKIFKTALQRLFFSRSYLAKIICAFILAFISPYILEMVSQAAKLLSPQIVEALRQGNGYNIGILQVPSLDILNQPYYDRIITGILSGSLFHCLIAVVAAGVIKQEFSGGYVNLAVMHGQSRSALYAKYTLANVVGVIPMIIVYPAGVYISLLSRGSTAYESMARIIGILFVQSFMIIALTVCFTSIGIMFDGKGAAFTCICLALSLPYVPNYLSIFTNGKINIEKYVLISRLINSSEMSMPDAGGHILTAIITAAVCYCLGWLVFENKNFN